MATIKDIAKILVEKHQLKDAAANEFLQQVVEVINEGLMKDRIVKIKGLGTFKLQEMKERESVNVNTGEPVLIAAHDKVTFTPDAVMRDLINKPFAQFETVILNEETSSPEPEPAPVVEPEPAPEPAPVVEPEPVVEKVDEVEEEIVDEEEEEESHTFSIVAHVICTLIIAAAFFALGYAASKYCWFEKPEAVKVEKVKKVENAEKVKKVENAEKVKKVEKVEKDAPKPAPETTDAAAYNKDPRVKHGAYIITGTQTSVTVHKGQTLKGISKAYLGPGMECYVEAYNGKKDVKPGDKLLIPSLKHKKLKK